MTAQAVIEDVGGQAGQPTRRAPGLTSRALR
jgi:hypothetical protein